MDFVLFMLFSVLEMIALYYLMFRLFKFEIYKSSILFASVLSSYISYTIRVQMEMNSLDILVQISLIFLFVRFLFQVHVFYASIMTAVTYVSYAVLQLLLYFILQNLKLLPSVPHPLDIRTYLLQISTVGVAYLLGEWVHKKRKGFDFVPHSHFGKVSITGINQILMFLYIPTLISSSLIFYFYENTHNWMYYIIPLSIALLLYIFLFWSYRKDRLEALERLNRRRNLI